MISNIMLRSNLIQIRRNLRANVFDSQLRTEESRAFFFLILRVTNIMHAHFDKIENSPYSNCKSDLDGIGRRTS